MERTYPFIGWRLLPSFKPVQVEIVRQHSTWNPEWLVDARGKIFVVSEICATKAEAITRGRERLEAMGEKYRAMGVSIYKKTQALDAAEAE
jgi:hypothetical protein